MDTIKWDERYRLGFEMIDSQHQEIFRLFDQVSTRLETQDYHGMVDQIVRFLDEYIVYHFSQEEEFQEFVGYPQVEEHRVFHQQFIAEFERYKQSLKGNGPPMNAIRGLNMLADWLVEHIQKEDYRLVRYIKENNL